MKTMKVMATLCFFLLMSCGKSSSTSLASQDPSPGSQQDEGSTTPDTNTIGDVLKFCSKLDFKGMAIPVDRTEDEINSWALGLNITGSFEGHQGWINITNNFDGQGLSMGLLNQTLGTGSLQPLLIQMHQSAPQTLKAQFEINRYKSLIGMLDTWSSLSIKPAKTEDPLVQPDDVPLNSLDMDGEDGMIKVTAAAENQLSVNWAVSNIYTDGAGKTFKAEWKRELQALMSTASYRSLQMNASLKLHEKAVRYMKLFKLQNLNSYLFNFDIVVQNGGFYEKNITEFNAFMVKNPNATEDQKLFALLTSRLVQVKSQFREDVRLRKTALINGQGTVHGTKRNFRTEYCY